MSGVLGTGLRAAWQASFQVNPIYLTGGSFSTAPGSIYSLGTLAYAVGGEIVSQLTGSQPWPGQWIVLPGAAIVKQSVATYPFASQQVAANATVQEPLTLSMLFRAPANELFGYLSKLGIFMALQAALIAHNNAGGTYTVLTPSSIYQNGLLLNVFDATDGETHQEQVDWQFDFFFPLITQQQANASVSRAMSKLSNGQQIIGPPSWSSLNS